MPGDMDPAHLKIRPSIPEESIFQVINENPNFKDNGCVFAHRSGQYSATKGLSAVFLIMRST